MSHKQRLELFALRQSYREESSRLEDQTVGNRKYLGQRVIEGGLQTFLGVETDKLAVGIELGVSDRTYEVSQVIDGARLRSSLDDGSLFSLTFG